LVERFSVFACFWLILTSSLTKKQSGMKHLLLAIAAFAFITISASAQGGGRKSPHDTTKTDNITVTYGRPYKKGRDIFGGLEPYGKVWRLGADQATTISFSKDVTFGGKPVKAGTYTLFAVPRENEWEFILNTQPGQWGAYSYEQHKDKDVAKFSVPVKKLESPVEQLTISFPQPTSMVVEWDKTQVTVPVKF
jgi:hypothetical protein